jgi:hypothetical protein
MPSSAVVTSSQTPAQPRGTVTNTSDLELAGSLLHHEAAAQCVDVRERTILSKTDNTPNLFCQRKGSTTSTGGAPAYLLRAQALHQRHHRDKLYIPRHDFIAGLGNSMSDDASRLHDLTDSEFLAHFNSTYPQKASWKVWTPTPRILSAVTLSLHRKKPCDPALLLNVPPAPTATGNSGPISVTNWPLTPYSPTSSSKFLPSDTAPTPSLPRVSMSYLAPLKMPYGVLGRHSRVWGNPTDI